jgi:tetratricopeptide (TPR) repeat protein
LISLFLIAIIAYGVYWFSSKIVNIDKKQKKHNHTPLFFTAFVVAILLGFLGFIIYRSATAPDVQCGETHAAASKLPANLKSAMNYFEQGNYDYDIGDCNRAIADYTTSIKLDPTNPQIYNNRAYTYMRMRNYKLALADLDTALKLKPDYIQALMNRADIHSYYYDIDRQNAVIDYKKAKSLGATQKKTSVCGHLFLAEHNGWTLGAFIDLPKLIFTTCD